MVAETPSIEYKLLRRNWCAHPIRILVAGILRYHRIQVEGREHLPRQGAALLLPKHHAYRDLLVEGVVLYRETRRYATYVMKNGLWGILELIGGVKVVRPKDIRKLKDREARKAEIQRARQANRYLQGYLTWLYRRGELVASHPEGMRYQGAMGPMQKEIVEHLIQAEGELETAIPMIPIGLEYESYWRPGARLYVRVGEPLFSHEFADMKDLIDTIETRIRRLSGLEH